MIYAFVFVAVCGCLGVLTFSVRQIINNISLRRLSSSTEEQNVDDNPAYGTDAAVIATET